MHKVTIKGTERELKYLFTSFLRMQEEQGLNVFDPEAWQSSPRFTTVLLWGGLIADDPKLTLADVAGSIDIKGFRALNKTVMDAVHAALPAAEKNEDAEPAPVP